MEYCIKIDEFEGPLDLLLHLIKESNIDIYNINIASITEQYLAYINKWEELNIDIASSYLVMAATLIELKSSSLLPQKSKDSDNTEEEEINTKEALINRLLEYQKYKEITKNFKALESKRKDIYTKAPSKLNELVETKLVNDTDTSVDDLVNAFALFLERKNMEKPIITKVTNREYSVKKRKKYIKDFLLTHGRAEFSELFTIYNKSYVVVTFLSILELTKENDITIMQEANFDKIYIELKTR